MRTHRRRAFGLLSSLVAAIVVAGADAGAETRFGPHDVRTLFAIGKNTDKNEVQYGIRLDAQCLPVGDEPVYAYWRQYEKGPEITADLNWLDRTGYGIAKQRVEQRSAAGSRVVMSLRATSDRSIAIQVHKGEKACEAEAISYIARVPSKLDRIHVQLTGPLSIAWIDIRGARLDDGRAISERTKP
jgi:hypothetical protein